MIVAFLGAKRLPLFWYLSSFLAFVFRYPTRSKIVEFLEAKNMTTILVLATMVAATMMIDTNYFGAI